MFILFIFILSKLNIINFKLICNIWIKLNEFFYKRIFILFLLYFKGKCLIYYMLVFYFVELY